MIGVLRGRSCGLGPEQDQWVIEVRRKGKKKNGKLKVDGELGMWVVVFIY